MTRLVDVITHRELQIVRDLDLPQGDYAIFGSGPLLVRGIIDQINDLDVICRGRAWDYAQVHGEPGYLEQFGVTIASMLNGRITFGTKWGIGDFDIDKLIDTADRIQGLQFVRLEHVIRYKELAGRPKDRVHLEAIERYLQERQE